jgi:hypothetical protein
MARQLVKFCLDLVGVDEVRYYKGDFEQADCCTFLYAKQNENYQFGTGCFCTSANYVSSRVC